MNNYLNAVAEIATERKKYFENYKYYAKLIKDTVKLKDVKVIVFGSVIEDKHTMASDIDVLIISDDVPGKLDERAKILMEIGKVVGSFHPFELHMMTWKEFEWYKMFLKNYVEI